MCDVPADPVRRGPDSVSVEPWDRPADPQVQILVKAAQSGLGRTLHGHAG